MRGAMSLATLICLAALVGVQCLPMNLAWAQDDGLTEGDSSGEQALDDLGSDLELDEPLADDVEAVAEEAVAPPSEEHAAPPADELEAKEELGSVRSEESLSQAPLVPAATSTNEPPAHRAVRLRLGAGLGYGELGYQRPINVGEEVLAETSFAAASLSAALELFPNRVLSLEVQAAYQTSIGMTLEIDPLFALPERVSTRFQYLEAGLTPVLRLGDSSRSAALALPLAFGIRTFSPNVRQYSIERFVLGGPQARLELRLPLGELVSLRLGPEAQWVLLINSGLADQGACCQGVSVGGQGLLEAHVGSVLRAQLFYREAHTFVPTVSSRFRSVERFLMACIAGEL